MKLSPREIEVLMETFGMYLILGAAAWGISFVACLKANPRWRHWLRLGVLSGLLVGIAFLRPPIVARPMVPRDPYFAEWAGVSKGFLTLFAWWFGALASAIVLSIKRKWESQNQQIQPIARKPGSG